MAAYRYRFYGASIIVTSLYGSLSDGVYCAKGIVKRLYGCLQRQFTVLGLL